MHKTILASFTLVAALTANAMDIGKPAPAFTMQRVGAAPLSLNQYKGKVVVMAFILTTCPHCQNLTRGIVSISKEYAAKGVQFVECAFNAGANAAIPGFVDQFQVPFPVGWADQAQVMGYLGISIMEARNFYVPHLVILDKQGNVHGDYPAQDAFMQNPEANIRAELDKMLKAPAHAAASKK